MENNKLIAEFMGCPEEDGYFGVYEDSEAVRWWDRYSTKSFCGDDYTIYYAFRPEEMHYGTSWDWLMPVVEKIKSNTFFEPIAGDGLAYVMDLAIDEALATAKIDRVFDAVVEFIKWYNTL